MQAKQRDDIQDSEQRTVAWHREVTGGGAGHEALQAVGGRQGREWVQKEGEQKCQDGPAESRAGGPARVLGSAPSAAPSAGSGQSRLH